MPCLGLEMPVATQKTDTGLTMGLLKILHRQVQMLPDHVDRLSADVSVDLAESDVITRRNTGEVRSSQYSTRAVR